MQDAQAHTRFQQLQRGRELTAAESSKVQSRVMDSLGQKPADFSKGQSMSGSGSVQPLGSASQCESSRDNVCKMDGHTPTKLPLDTCFNFLSIVHVKKCYSPHLSSITEKNKKLSYLVVISTGTGCQTSQEPRNITSRKKNGTASVSLPS